MIGKFIELRGKGYVSKMNDFIAFLQNKYIYVPFFLWFGIQLFKLIYDLVTTKKFNFKRIMGAGRNAKFSFSSSS